MSLFDWLFVGHFVGDYLFQTGWLAMNKMKRWDALFVHCVVYTVAIGIAGACSTGVSPLALGVVFVSHLIIDQGWLVRKWTQYIQSPPKSEQKWLTIMADQSFHLIILAIAAVMSAR